MMKVYPIVVSVILVHAMGSANEAIRLQEFIYEEASFPSCHASTLVEVDPGHILAAWFGGTDEGENDVGIWISHRENDSWSAPVEVAQHKSVPCWNPVLWKDNRSGRIVLFYKAGPSPQTWTGFLRRSEDGGRSWSETEQLPAGILGPIRAKPYQLEDGTLLCGSSVESWKAWGCRCEITKDLGKTWDITNPINLEDDYNGLIQPTIFRSGPNSLGMLTRSRKVRRIAMANSDDNGMTWSQAKSIDLPNPSAGIDTVNLDDGRVALIYNHTEQGREVLNIAVSLDHGKTWNRVLDLENTPGEEFSYPAMVLTRDGLLSCTYTWRRKRIRFAKIDPKKL